MRCIHDYDVYIFDCDGVILNSNQLKIKAMMNTLDFFSFNKNDIGICLDYFSKNFGMSRFHHVDVFCDVFLKIPRSKADNVKNEIITIFSHQCKSLYLNADLTPGFIDFVNSLNGFKYVASGSEQEELRWVFSKRGISDYFNDIFGSPTHKSDLVNCILKKHQDANLIMFGDAVSDFKSADNNNIDFIGYLPFTNVKDEMLALAKSNNFKTIEDWRELEC